MPKATKLTTGYTLAEVLIALVLLGVIAALVIPKILINSANQRRNSVMTETIALLSDTTHQGVITRELNYLRMSDYYFQKLNFQQVALPNSGGCIANGIMASGSPDPQWGSDTWNNNNSVGGGILPNGVSVCGFLDYNCYTCLGPSGPPEASGTAILLDWNNSAGPNTIGEDRLMLQLSYGLEPKTSIYAFTPLHPGQVKAIETNGVSAAANYKLYQEVLNLR